MKRIFGILPTIINYLHTTKTSKIIIDGLIVSTVLVLSGFVTHNLPIPKQIIDIPHWVYYITITFICMSYLIGNKWITINYPKTHNVEDSCQVSQHIQNILSAEIYKTNYSFAGLYLFSNGVTSLSGFPFLKYSLIAHASDITTHIDVTANQGIPIGVNLPMVACLIENKSYTGFVTTNSPFTGMGFQSYRVEPINGRTGHLVGFILVGSQDSHTPDQEFIKNIVKNVINFV